MVLPVRLFSRFMTMQSNIHSSERSSHHLTFELGFHSLCSLWHLGALLCIVCCRMCAYFTVYYEIVLLSCVCSNFWNHSFVFSHISYCFSCLWKKFVSFTDNFVYRIKLLSFSPLPPSFNPAIYFHPLSSFPPSLLALQPASWWTRAYWRWLPRQAAHQPAHCSPWRTPCTSHTCTSRETARDHRGLPASSTRALAGSATRWPPVRPSASMTSCWLWWRSCAGRSSSCSTTSSMVSDQHTCRCCAGLRKLIFWALKIESWDLCELWNIWRSVEIQLLAESWYLL